MITKKWLWIGAGLGVFWLLSYTKRKTRADTISELKQDLLQTKSNLTRVGYQGVIPPADPTPATASPSSLNVDPQRQPGSLSNLTPIVIR